MSWEPVRYSRFEEERNRPCADLIRALGDAKPQRIVDMGCGPGNSTEALARRFPGAAILALDSDAAMVDAARRRLPDITVTQADVTSWRPDSPVDLLFSNAVFHWVPDHLPLLRELGTCLAPGGMLAIQMPDNLEEPTHRLMEEIARSPEFLEAFEGKPPTRTPLPQPRDYVQVLGSEGFSVTVWRTTYYHRLADAEGIVDFVRGAGLRPYLDRLEEKAGASSVQAYLAAYTAAIGEAYPPLGDGSVLLAMPRLFVVAARD